MMPESARTRLTREAIEQAFDLVGRKSAARGIVAEIAVFGGSSLVLASNIREASGDIDAVYEHRSRSTLFEIVSEVAREQDLPADWMNEAVKRVAPPPNEPKPPTDLFADYPRDCASGTGLRVFVARPEYILAMKLLANREGGLDETQKIDTDRSDALALMRVTKTDSKEKLLELLKQFCPNIMAMVEAGGTTLQARLSAKIEDLTDAYQRYAPVPSPTWNVGRGDPPGGGRSR